MFFRRSDLPSDGWLFGQHPCSVDVGGVVPLVELREGQKVPICAESSAVLRSLTDALTRSVSEHEAVDIYLLAGTVIAVVPVRTEALVG